MIIFEKQNTGMKKGILISLLLFIYTIIGIAQTPSFVVVIDAGHGGHDPGAVGSFSYEKDINLAIALAFGKKIKENDPTVKVIYTRDTDKFLTLQERADIPNNAHADLFVCIHTNSSTSSVPYGSETYTLGLAKSKSNLNVAMRENSVMLLEDNYQTRYKGFDPNSVDSYIMFEFIQDKYLDKSLSFAQDVQRNFEKKGRVDKGVRQAGFWVLHKTAAPSVLIELGYISNKQEELFLNSDEGQDQMAEAIYNAFSRYKRDYQRKSGKDAVASAKTTTNESKNDLSKPYVPKTAATQPAKEPAATQETNAQLPVKPIVVNTEKTPVTVAEQQKEENTSNLPKPGTKPVTIKETPANTEIPTAKSPANTPAQVNPEKKPATTVEQLKESSLAKPPKAEPKPAVEGDPVFKEIPIALTPQTNPAVAQKDEIIFTIQLFALNKKLPKNSPEFKGLTTSYIYDNSGTYKYVYSSSPDYMEAQKIKNSISDKFPDAWIIALKNGERISLNEALKTKQP